jgi:hypothetical protein
MALLFGLVVALHAVAAPPRVLVVRSPGDAAVSGRMIAELAALGFDVSEVVDPTPEQPLVEVAQTSGAVAAVRATPSERRVELWVVDPSTQATAFEETVSIDGRPDVLAVHAVEVLRARLVKVGLAEPPPPSRAVEHPPTPEHRAAEPAPEPRSGDVPLVWLGIGPAVQLSAGGLGPIPSAILDIRAAPLASLSLLGFVTLPLTSARVESVEGSADLEPALAGLVAEMQTSGKRWTLALGAGAGVLWVDMRGANATEDYVARSDRVTGVAGFGDVAVCRSLLDGLSTCADLWFGSAMPRVAVRFGDREVATWGRPFGMASLRLEIAVPGLSR